MKDKGGKQVLCILMMVARFGIPLALYPTLYSFKMLLIMESPHWICSVLSQRTPVSGNPVSLSNYSQLNLSIMLMKKLWQ